MREKINSWDEKYPGQNKIKDPESENKINTLSEQYEG